MTALPDELEDLWTDFRRSLARRNRSSSTATVYRKSFEKLLAPGSRGGHRTGPVVVDSATINKWTDHLLVVLVVRNGVVVEEDDPTTGKRRPKMLEPSTIHIRYINLRPFFSWYAVEFETDNPFARSDAPDEGRSEPIPVVPLDDVRRLLATCDGRDFTDRRDTAIIRILYDTAGGWANRRAERRRLGPSSGLPDSSRQDGNSGRAAVSIDR